MAVLPEMRQTTQRVFEERADTGSIMIVRCARPTNNVVCGLFGVAAEQGRFEWVIHEPRTNYISSNSQVQDVFRLPYTPLQMATVTETTTLLTSTNLSRGHARRRLSTSYAARQRARLHCQPLPSSVDALDLSLSSPLTVCANIRLHVLSYLADLETRLALLESPISESLKSKGGSTVEEARIWAKTTLEMLNQIRTDVCSQLPELHLETPFVEEFVKSHIPDVPRLDDVRAHLPAMPDAVRSRLPDITISDMRSRLEDVRSSFSDIDFRRPLEYIPTLSEHLQSLQSHLASVDLPQSFCDSFTYLKPHASLSELLERVLSSDLVAGMSSDIRGGEDMLEKADLETARAIRRSLNGSRLIHYVDLPEKWRNNRFVARGYR